MLVDGYNVMHKIKKLKPSLQNNLEEARGIFISMIEEKVQEGSINTRLVVVFDGKGDADSTPGYTLERGKIKVMFSRPPKNADMLLCQLMDEESAPKNVMVVSSDNEVLCSAKCRLIKTQKSEAFIEKLMQTQKQEKSKKESPRMSEGEIAYWMKIFKKKA